MLGQVLQEYYIMLQLWYQQHLVDFRCLIRILLCLSPRQMRTSQSHQLERLRINVISDFGCRSTHMDFQPPFSGVFRLSHLGVIAGYLMQTVVRFSRFDEGL